MTTARTNRKAKARPPARKKRARRAMSTKALEALRGALLAALEQAGDPDALLQVDVIGPGWSVVRYQPAGRDRLWVKSAAGPFGQLELDALLAQGGVELDHRSQVGYVLRAHLERLAAPLEHAQRR